MELLIPDPVTQSCEISFHNYPLIYTECLKFLHLHILYYTFVSGENLHFLLSLL